MRCQQAPRELCPLPEGPGLPKEAEAVQDAPTEPLNRPLHGKQRKWLYD